MKTEDHPILRDPDLSGLEIRFARADAHAFPKHAHDGHYLIGLMERGGAWCVNPGDDRNFVAPGELALLNPGLVHTGIPPRDQPSSYRMINLDLAFMRGLANDVTDGRIELPEFERIVVREPASWSLLFGLTGLMAAGCDRLEKETILFSGLAPLICRHAGRAGALREPGPEPKAIRVAREFLSENLGDKLSLQEVADAAGLSRHHLIRVFGKACGLPPHAFRTQRRVEAAKQLLRRKRPIADVALETGFTDQSHFTHAFKRFTGVTPGQYLGE